MISMIKIQKMPCSGPGKLLTLTGYSSVLSKLPKARWFTSESRSSLNTISWPLIVLHLSVVAFFCHRNLVSALVVITQIQRLCNCFTAAKTLCSKIPQKIRLNIYEKRNVSWQLNVKHNKYRLTIVGQLTIAANLPPQVHLGIT